MSHDASETLIAAAAATAPVPIHLVSTAQIDSALEGAGAMAKATALREGFKGVAGTALVVPGADGAIARVLAGTGESGDMAALRGLPARLPAGDYMLADAEAGAMEVALAWGLGSYVFDRYKADHGKARPRLVAPEGVDVAAVRSIVHATGLARDMINTPANDMGPRQIETIAREVAEAYGAAIAVTTGDDLLEASYPAIHAVGRAAVPARAARLIELDWAGPEAGESAPRIALVGKGVVFDTGGLDIKPSAGMRLMKKDMGGAAHALALGRMVMDAGLPVRLTVLLPVVENAIAGDAMRPGDVLATRAGLSVEVGNTDAEGRLILADALTRAAELQPELTIDLATLTGAARVALGPDLPPFYTDDDALAADLAEAARTVSDPLWRLPLWAGYEGALDSDTADLKNDPDGWAQAGSVTAALFLKRFAPTCGAWLHLDIFGWNPRKRPGFPVGGEAQAIRALFQLLQTRYGSMA
ncbi:MAG: leucyl aminopeptidase family protein [Caulobacteraceae bacterium]